MPVGSHLRITKAGPRPVDQALWVRAAQLAQEAPLPAVVRNVLCGTAGWTDPTLLSCGRFYPSSATTPEARLRFYASRFSMVEVDATYYALPTRALTERWIERTPSHFVFDVKAFASLTGHQVELARLAPELRALVPASLAGKARVFAKELPEELRTVLRERFVDALEPLHRASRLGAVFLQYPPWFEATRGNVRVLEQTRAALGALPLAIEFRHASWGAPERFPRVLSLLRSLGASYVCVDEPQGLRNSMPSHVGVSAPSLAVVRFHGRRTETWDRSASVTEKFDYLYRPEELAPWVSRVRSLAEQAETVHAVFNNCVSDYAVVNARDLAALLSKDEPTQGQHPSGAVLRLANG